MHVHAEEAADVMTETTIKRDTNMCDGDTFNVDLVIGSKGTENGFGAK